MKFSTPVLLAAVPGHHSAVIVILEHLEIIVLMLLM
jgi:hypothetical protein